MTLSQTTNRFFFAASLAAIIMINGCDTTENPPTDTTPHPAFNANINGQAWSATGPEAADDRIYANPVVVGSKLEIKAFHTVNGKSDVLSLRISSPQEGTNILKPTLDQTEQTASFLPGGLLDSTYYMTSSDSGAVILDHYTDGTTRISGSFWFTASNNNQKRLTVTTGTFKDVLIRK